MGGMHFLDTSVDLQWAFVGTSGETLEIAPTMPGGFWK